MLARLNPNLSIRVWGGDLAPYYAFSLDFIDGQGRYIRPPPNIKMYSDLQGEVLSIEENFRRLRRN